MKQIKDINQNWAGPKNFDICSSIIFSCYGQSFTSAVETGHQILFPRNFKIFLILAQFLKLYVVWQLMRQLVHKVCYNRYQVTLYLWQITRVTRYCKISNYCFCDLLKTFTLLLMSFITIQFLGFQMSLFDLKRPCEILSA